MARKKRRKAGKRKKKSNISGFAGMLFGLAIGLSVALYVYIDSSGGITLPQPDNTATPEPPQPAPAPVEEEPGITFDFYDMLPNLDVPVYVDDRTAPRPPAPAPVTAPGVYIVQAGSFGKIDDANRRKAQIALLGVKSEIKRGTANDRTVYRVYTSPMENPAEVNRVSNLLRNNDIEILLKRVSE